MSKYLKGQKVEGMRVENATFFESQVFGPNASYQRRYEINKKWRGADRPDTSKITLPHVRIQHINIDAIGAKHERN